MLKRSRHYVKRPAIGLPLSTMQPIVTPKIQEKIKLTTFQEADEFNASVNACSTSLAVIAPFGTP